VLQDCEEWARNELNAGKAPRPYHLTEKAQSKVSSMIEKKTDLLPFGNLLGNSSTTTATTGKKQTKPKKVDEPVIINQANLKEGSGDIENNENNIKQQQQLSPMQKKMRSFKDKENVGNKKVVVKKEEPVKKGKQKTTWGGDDVKVEDLDYSDTKNVENAPVESTKYTVGNVTGTMKGDLRGIDVGESSEEELEVEQKPHKNENVEVNGKNKKTSSSFGLFSSLKSLVGSKVLTQETIEPIMEKMQEHLVTKNVAMEIAKKLCDNVAANLEGKQLGSFQFAANIIKQALHESLVQILTPKRRINILRDVIDAKSQQRPYVIVFCGVNGVGKSTNLAKVTFWLIENSHRVLIAACDTFRAGAVEQLRTHTRHLNALHPAEENNGQQMVELYEKGYGKDAAGIALEAINYARNNRIDVVLVDTAGRMQDNEPLMKALAKLININQPDLVLFVGEALVGNEAVDQVKKFNQALYDNSSVVNKNEQARLIDGIVLTKFDTIDDKVGAAISMTYTTGQPIVFVGTGQTYADLKNLNAESVVKSLLK
jgi:signal recognition particle receptor subunit alpha